MRTGVNNTSIHCLVAGQIILLVLSVFLLGCSGSGANNITGDKLAEQTGSDAPLTIVDVRSSDEYNSGHVPGAIHIPYWSVFTRHSSIPSAPDEPVIIYCEHGPRATLAKLGLRIVGFTQVVYLTGHMTSWRKAGLPVETSTAP